jgi:hypothetical protein
MVKEINLEETLINLGIVKAVQYNNNDLLLIETVMVENQSWATYVR